MKNLCVRFFPEKDSWAKPSKYHQPTTFNFHNCSVYFVGSMVVGKQQAGGIANRLWHGIPVGHSNKVCQKIKTDSLNDMLFRFC